jgi:polyhydroxybutyrate depolymerase
MNTRTSLLALVAIGVFSSCGAATVHVRTAARANTAQRSSAQRSSAQRSSAEHSPSATAPTVAQPIVVALGIATTEAPEPARTDVLTIESGGNERFALIHTPEHQRTLLPVVIALHGSSSSGETLQAETGFDDTADRNGFIVVYPEGLSINGEQSWNSGQCCEPATSATVDDVGFIRDLIEKLKVAYPIDATRVFVTGHSNGAIMAQKLACRLTDRITAVASVSGALDDVASCHPSRPISMLEIHGTADENVFYEYGEQSAQAWRSFDNCVREMSTNIAEGLSVSGSSACTNDTSVQLLTIDGGPHAWPFDGAQTVWNFFAAQPPLDPA